MIRFRLRITRSADREKSNLDAKALAIEIVQDVQEPERPTVTQPVGHEVYRPGHVRALWHRHDVGFVPLQPFARLDPQVQCQLAIDAVNPFMVLRMALDIAQVQVQVQVQKT